MRFAYGHYVHLTKSADPTKMKPCDSAHGRCQKVWVRPWQTLGEALQELRERRSVSDGGSVDRARQ